MSNLSTKFENLFSTIVTLRGTNGCPWDKKQTLNSIRKYVESEAAELLEGIDRNDSPNICEELGDILYLIILIADIEKKAGHFSLDDVIEGINDKLIRRHPHVFGDVKYESEEQLRKQWDAIKAAEKKSSKSV